MASLSGATIATTFKSLLKLAGNTDDLAAGGSTAIQVMTGDGESTPLYLNTDRLGIGASDPDYTLDVASNIGIRTAAGQSIGIEIGYGGTAYGSVKFNRHASSLASSIGMQYTVNSYGDHTFLGTSSRELMYLEGGNAANNPGVITFHTEAANTVFEAISGVQPRLVIQQAKGLMWECDNDAHADSRAYMMVTDYGAYGDLRILQTTARNNTIGTNTSRLTIDKDGVVTVAAGAVTSDVRLKKNIKDITDGLDVINSLQGRTFEWKASANNGLGTKYGFIAQELEQVVPDLVSGNGSHEISEGERSKSINTGGIIPILVEAVKELSAKVTALENA